MENPNIQIIEKEEVSALHFPAEEILTSERERKTRATSIERAISLGNLEHHKVRIYFADAEGEKRVDTTIWAVTDSAIVLKQHTILPINRILKLEI